jgi:multidrug efflux pump subunit AcrA (membrane-fusion protein)
VPQDELPKVAIGQQANIVMDSFAGKNIPGKVTALPSAALGSSTGSGNGSSGNQGGNASGQSGSGGNQSSSAPPTLDTAPRITVQWPGPGAELGQLARVTLTVQTKDNVLKIPTAAVNKINNRTFVMLDESGRQTPVDIKVGIQTDQWTEVLSGLSAGQQVFSRGQ